ncbi:ATP-binding cassette domain-containing protein [Ruminococcus sp.]|uniref:ABC transporter ATP-binding protein n=1 Tax=Ruminococcus sp. TaxID=41978 RepID=UPI0025F4F3C6|nr:ATP-binding cassette domain-containing protein [Ruminococcus sp.]MBQ8966383.1 ATP-binding cassette domain-containing protein [Ruminococcus sp.]
MPEIIKIENMTKDYGNGRGIFDFNISINEGEIYGLVGTNGSGKTTTMRHLMGFLAPDSGSCEIGGINCRQHPEVIMKRVGYVPGQIDFPDVGSGTNFLKIQAQYLGITDMSYTEKLIDLFKIDTSAPLKRMSKGMKQKMALVAAFMAKPDILLLDEPSTGLDPVMRDAMIELILEQKKRGATVFMSSHIFKELEDTCDKVTFIHNGRIINTIGRDIFDENMPKLYRVGFADEEQYLEFKKRTDLHIKSFNDKYKHLMAAVPVDAVNSFVRELADYNMRYVRYVPYSLEMYYKNEIENGGVL